MSTPSPPPITYDVSSLTSEDFYGFWPSTALASTALALFLMAGLIVAVQIFKSKNKNARYMQLVTITGFIEAGGYASILWLINNSGKTSIYAAYVISQTFLILSPNLLQAANYSTAGKISLLSGMSQEKRILKPLVLTSTFIGLDVFALVIQAIGITIWATSKGSGKPDTKAITLGSWITVAGLAVQLVSFCLFTFLALWIQRSPKNTLKGSSEHKKLFTGLYLTIVFVSIRNIFRFVEFVQGAVLTWPVMDPNTYVLSEKEVLFYTLDTLPILFCFVGFIVYNPANLLPKYLVNPKTGERLPVGAGDVEGGGVVGAIEGQVSGSKESLDNEGIKKSVSADNSV
jgi:hypothetical protein